ncbi:predicted protein [Colletotrichum tofieldiae]|nr:predicted protein [Colletotrichum tofieldiae]
MTYPMPRLDPEIDAVVRAAGRSLAHDEYPDLPTLRRRNEAESILELSKFEEGSVPNIEQTVFDIHSYDGATIKLYRFGTAEHRKNIVQSAVLYFHGGGFVTGTVEMYGHLLRTLPGILGAQIFAVDYRLAPEHPFPTPAEDCYAGLLWLHGNASTFGIDPARIAVMGDSAGGSLALTLSFFACERKLSPPIAKQILVYPMLDDRTRVPVEDPMTPYTTWSQRDNMLAWEAYLGKGHAEKPDVEIPAFAVAARVADLKGLPPTYMDVGGFDIFRDENIAFAARLSKASVEVEFHLYPGLPHAFEGIAPLSSITQRATANRAASFGAV